MVLVVACALRAPIFPNVRFGVKADWEYVTRMSYLHEQAEQRTGEPYSAVPDYKANQDFSILRLILEKEPRCWK